MEWAILAAFCAGLLLCIAFDITILFALIFGLALFMFYGRHQGLKWRELILSAVEGIKTVKTLLVTFLLIGVMTGFWRAAGTIPVIVCYASRLIRPSVFLLMTFLLNGGMSVLTGTSFGTAATMGVICATMGAALGASPFLTGGAILSGAYFGDRCSPVSTSALLVSNVTGTDIYDNIRLMLRSALVPFVLTCLIYLFIGPKGSGTDAGEQVTSLFSRAFSLTWIALIPAVTILLFSVFRANVKLSMIASIVTAIPICLFIQDISLPELFRIAVLGYHPKDEALAALLSGGGLVSMLNVTGIVLLSSSYVNIFQITGLLDGLKRKISWLSRKSSIFFATLLTSVLSGMIACNQTLTILLTNQICKEEYSNRSRLALDLEDTAVVIAALIPWSIAGGVPLATVGAPLISMLFSFYLIILPLYRLFLSLLLQVNKQFSSRA